jgi:hypothetical protein
MESDKAKDHHVKAASVKDEDPVALYKQAAAYERQGKLDIGKCSQ